MDKAELIRHEIEKRRDHNLAIGNPLFVAIAEEDIELLLFIDSLQEEPKPKFKIGDMVVSESGKYAKIESIDTDKYWCKGENGMSIPFKYQDKWKLVEEPVSEDLEKASRNYADNEEYGDDVYFAIEAAFKSGAEWQKEHHQAEKALELTWEDIREICTQSVLVEFDLGRNITDEIHYTEVLNRFNKQKGK